ncbi:hypothetical protein M378DRAFT_375442 [Amanita muscaria Koide BX008]|uniref:Uncharacterized protein n=1 Tax=Amanita muscaria (strain Koide BX008) TaxID=946122 RepID=A0A0C2WLS2_AMAMK|nr:hypothetical protein M378DRAFT_375442 [Amanita muscaria Koide BX008]
MARHSLTPSCPLPTSTQFKLPARGSCTIFPLLPFFLARYRLHKAPSVSSRVWNALREIVQVIRTEEYQYQDPVTTFLKELYVEFDFEACVKGVERGGRHAYCRIHQKIDIIDLSERLDST